MFYEGKCRHKQSYNIYKSYRKRKADLFFLFGDKKNDETILMKVKKYCVVTWQQISKWKIYQAFPTEINIDH